MRLGGRDVGRGPPATATTCICSSAKAWQVEKQEVDLFFGQMEVPLQQMPIILQKKRIFWRFMVNFVFIKIGLGNNCWSTKFVLPNPLSWTSAVAFRLEK